MLTFLNKFMKVDIYWVENGSKCHLLSVRLMLSLSNRAHFIMHADGDASTHEFTLFLQPFTLYFSMLPLLTAVEAPLGSSSRAVAVY